MKKENSNSDPKKSFRLEEIPRKQIFQVPERYFDELPGIIQSRIAEKEYSPWWRVYLTPANGWRVAIVTAVVTLILVFSGVFNREVVNVSAESLLADVSLEDLIEYVEYSDISTDEILAEVDFSDYDMDFLMGEDIQLIDDLDFQDLEEIDLYEEYGIEDELF